MEAKDYYPQGAFNDASAPYNERETRYVDFAVDVDVTMHKSEKVYTNDYAEEYDDEDGHTYYNTDDTDWDDAYKGSCITLSEMLDELRQYVEHDISVTGKNTSKGRYLQRLLNACQGWETVETEVRPQ